MNRVTLQRTRFTNLHLEQLPDGANCLADIPEKDETLGLRMYDDFSQTYCNNIESRELMLPDEDFLKFVYEAADDLATDMFDFAMDNGMYIDDNWYEAEWVNKVLATAETQSPENLI